MNEFQTRAYGKINLALDILGTRPDGYHEVRMIMQSVSLADEVCLKKTAGQDIAMRASVAFLPVDQRNLMVRAAKLMFETYGIAGGIDMTLKKRIPVSAGMAGGSTDAAAVIYGINKMYDLQLSMEEMQAIGVKIGADVPFCIQRGTALSEGIGEKLTRLPACPRCQLVLVKPGVSVSTKAVYSAYDLLPQEEILHPDIDGMQKAIAEKDLQGVADRLGNVLESVTEKEVPAIRTIKEQLLAFGAENALMSGSGPTVFGIYKTKEAAEEAAGKMRETGLPVRVFTCHPAG